MNVLMGLFKTISAWSSRLQHWHKVAILLVVYDAFAANAAYFLALWFRFDGKYSLIPPYYFSAWLHFTLIYTAICLAAFWMFKLYRSIWRFASVAELLRIILCLSLTCTIHVVAITVFFHRMPILYHIAGATFQFLFTAGIRFSYRFYSLLLEQNKIIRRMPKAAHIMIIGAGDAGQMIIRDIHRSNKLQEEVCCIIDDDPNKWHRYIDNVPVVGGRDRIIPAVEEFGIDRIYVALPSASAEDKRDIITICNKTPCKLKQLPGMYQLVSDQITVTQLRDVAVEDLLGREPVHTDLTEVFRFINGKIVLVTGGGGSIGAELCRQIAEHNPKRLILFDNYENSAYEVQLELRKTFPDLSLEVLIGSVQDADKVFDLFATWRPQIVYHAAAHKHVPLMEDSPCEAVKNNVFGTYTLAYAAMLHGCESFVLISTDKAVNPTSIMGASKRLCEMIVQSMAALIRSEKADAMPQLFAVAPERHERTEYGQRLREAGTKFAAVRFGNVLGSNGSVIPIFRRQIERGGPVTVTHPDIVRYFMTIQEAVSLVLTAGTYARGGEIYVLDMGEEVRISDLARNMIKLSGFRPDIDIKIEYTGLRPGEKLFEEKLMAEEGLLKTENELIHIGRPIPFDTDAFLSQLTALREAAYANRKDIQALIGAMVPTYHPPAPEVP